MKNIIGTATATNLNDLRNAIAALCLAAPEEVYVSLNSDAVKLTLIEETLTDGSVVYNIELSEASK